MGRSVSDSRGKMGGGVWEHLLKKTDILGGARGCLNSLFI